MYRKCDCKKKDKILIKKRMIAKKRQKKKMKMCTCRERGLVLFCRPRLWADSVCLCVCVRVTIL